MKELISTAVPLNDPQLDSHQTDKHQGVKLPVMAKDSYYLSRLAKQLKQIKDKESEDYTSRFDRYQKQLKQSQERVQSRIASLPTIHLNEDLPVSQQADRLIKAIQDHQVIIVAGETGSGKTTQLPKIAMLAGRGVTGQIGHTQPRRLAARSVANRCLLYTSPSPRDS